MATKYNHDLFIEIRGLKRMRTLIVIWLRQFSPTSIQACTKFGHFVEKYCLNDLKSDWPENSQVLIVQKDLFCLNPGILSVYF